MKVKISIFHLESTELFIAVDITRFVVFSNLTPALKEVVGGLDPISMPLPAVL